jgi:hypothetical protein
VRELLQIIAWFQSTTVSQRLPGLFAMTLLALILALGVSLMLASKLLIG